MPSTRSNRLKRQSPNRQSHKFWCGKCDGCLIGKDQTCPRCGAKNLKGNKRRYKSKERFIDDIQ